MNERQRTEYLTALGVTSYMPRFRLPLAPEPLQAVLPSPVEGEALEDAPAAALMAAVGGSGNTSDPATVATLEEPVADAGARPPAIEPQVSRVIGSITAETRIAPAAPKQVAIAPREPSVGPFVLNCWWLGEELLAVDSREPGTALPVEALFGNIARALGWHQLGTEKDKLKWPMAENPFAAAAGASDARDTCSSWLEAAYARKPVKSIWLMGSQAREYCAPLSMDEAVADWHGTKVIVMPSLTELLRDPLRKRELWQLLRKQYPEQTRR
ncbi:hypothetical protein PVT68_07675 [Microbulbifer bruguierae]|uniref:Uracil-DNA glycosylase-like domain-containing protein n=1 Tax=Microbulbifer bruguierae TaxID=3029061 RepID=A0ABY8NKB5_9GAMM|nr:hypothetical protein [Microbulbifer bruguierae]WGL18167.1 hypothetical protein PVT68_07675 [Microbulbifer bruguierae]